MDIIKLFRDIEKFIYYHIERKLCKNKQSIIKQLKEIKFLCMYSICLDGKLINILY